MKKVFIGLLLLMLILTSMLSFTFIIKPSFAENSESNLQKNFLENTNQTAPSNNAANSQSVLEKNSSVMQKEPLKSLGQDSSHSVDWWDFNNTSEWYNFTYKDGDQTRLIVGVKADKSMDITELAEIAARHQAKIVNKVSIANKVRAAVVELSFRSVLSFVDEVRLAGLASYVEPDMKVQVQFEPNDPYWNLQWGPHKIEANWAWNITVGDPSVLVAIVDTGVDYNHPDLADNYVPLGYDWVNNDSDPLDDFGHGTHCAGIIAAVLNNSLGIAGLAQVHIMAEKSFDSWGYGYWDWAADGIIHAVDQGADIISMSFGGYADSELLHDAIKYAYDAGVLLVAAAGNENTNALSYPACYDEVIAVAATDQYDEKAYFSNWGDWVELAAPGVEIYSTMPAYYVTMNDWGFSMNYDYMDGTSMACPHVAGIAALVWSLYPNKTRDWVRLWLRYTADDLGDPGFDIYYGYGRINARNSVGMAPPAHELIAYEWKIPPYVEPAGTGIINATILNFGENSEINITVQLLANGTVVDSTLISFLACGDSTTVSLTWNPTVEGLYNVTLYVVPVPGETNVENNALSKPIYVGVPLKAVVLHSAGNVISDIITNWQVLNNQWCTFGKTMIYIDYTTLNKENITYEDIAATEADVLIISCACDPYSGWEFTDSEIEAIKQYVHEGHGLVATAGTLYYGVPNNNKLAPLFGLNETTPWDATATDLLELMNASHPIFTNVPNPLVFPQVGTALPYDGQWGSDELVGGSYLALGHYQESAIVTFRGLVYISPWLEIIPPYYHHHLQLLYNAITWSQYQKPKHELVVSLKAPNSLQPGESALISATVYNMGLSNETSVEFKLLINGTIVNSTSCELLMGESYTLSYFWTPTGGLYNITAYAPPLPGEEFVLNNRDSATIGVCYWASTFVTEDNWPIPPDNDLDYYMFNDDPKHPIEWAHWYGMSPRIVIAILQIYAYDVDSPDEVDEVYFNGFYVGQLQGANDQWTLNEFVVPASYIKYGFNVVEVYVDKTHVGWWAMSVDWGNLTVGYLWPEHELAVNLEAPTFLEPDTSTVLNATLQNLGLNNETDVDLQLWINSTKVANVTISELPTLTSFTLSYLWKPTIEGTYNVTAYVVPVPGENITINNVVMKNVLVRFMKYVLWDDVHDSDGDSLTGNYLSLYQLLSSSGFIIDELTSGTITSELLANYDILVLIDPEYDFSSTEISAIHEWVLSGGGLIVIPDAGYPSTLNTIMAPYGVQLTGTSSGYGTTTNIIPHPITMNVESIYYDRAWELAVSPPSENLSWTLEGYAFLSASADGEMVVISDSNIMDNDGLGMANNTQLMLNIFNWVGVKYEHELTVGLEAPTFLEPGESALLNATVYNKGLNNETNVDLFILINGTELSSAVIPELLTRASYTLSYVWTPAVEGTYNITAYAPPVPGENITLNNARQMLVSVKILPDILIVNDDDGGNWINGTSLTEFESALAVVGYDYWVWNESLMGNPSLDFLSRFKLVIWTCGDYRNWAVDPIDAETLEAYLAQGGNILLEGEDIGYNHDADNFMINVAHAMYEVDDTGAPGLTVTDTSHPVTFNLPPSFNWLTNPPYDDGVSPTNGGSEVIKYTGTTWTAVTVFEGGSGGLVVYYAFPLYCLQESHRETLAINSINWLLGIKYEHELAVALKSPSVLQLGNSVLLSATVQNIGLNNESDVEMFLLINGETVNSTVIPELQSGATFTITYLWTPTAEGLYNVTAYVPPVYNETFIQNNLITKNVIVSAFTLPTQYPLVYVYPYLATANVGDYFTVSVVVYNLTDAYAPDPDNPMATVPLGNLYGFDIQFSWDPTVIQYVNHTVTTPVEKYPNPVPPSPYAGILHGFGPGNTQILEIKNVVNETGNIPGAVDPRVRAWFCYATLYPADPFNGNGTIFIMTFKVVGSGQSPLEIVDCTLADQNGNLIARGSTGTWLNQPRSGTLIVGVPPGNRDVAVLNVTSFPHAVYPGRIVNITVVASNEGTITETFNVTVYANTTIIGVQSVTLDSWTNTTLTFQWNTTGLTPCSNFTIWAKASTVPDEINTENNVFTDDYVKIKILGDVNGDDIIDIYDIVEAAIAYYSRPGDPNWNPDADLTEPLGYVDICDIVTIASRYGMTP